MREKADRMFVCTAKVHERCTMERPDGTVLLGAFASATYHGS